MIDARPTDPQAQRLPDAPLRAERPPYWMAVGVFLGALLLYVVTLAPTTQFWDTSEYIAAAYVLGIPHPPGNPLFVLIAHVWGLVPWAAHYAARINLFAAATSAVAAACWFLVGERWLRSIVPARWPRRLAALAGALVAASAFTVWNQSVVNEKVYTLSLVSIALVLWLIVRWDDQPEGHGHDHHLLAIAYLIALTSTNHMMGVLVGSVVTILLFPPLKATRAIRPEAQRLAWSQWAVFTGLWLAIGTMGMESRALMVMAGVLLGLAFGYAIYARNWGFALVMLGAVAVGLSVYGFLPIRAAHYPPINEGEPTSWASFWAVFTREQYGKVPVTQRQASIIAQIGMWWQYFTWQWGHDWPVAVQRFLAVGFFFLGILGAWRHWVADRRSALAMTALMATLTVALIFYLNFKYGYSQYPDRPQLAREVRERDYFYIGSFALWGVWVGIGLATLMEWWQDALATRIPDAGRRWAMVTPVLLVAVIPLLGNRLTASRAGETLARDFAYDLLQSVEPHGVLVTAGDNDTFPLWYAQEVEGIRRDVTVVNLSLANTDWYLRQLRRRPVVDFDSATAPAIYRHQAWPKPPDPALNVPPEWLTNLQPYYVIADRQVVNLGGVDVTLDPKTLGRGYLERAEVVVLQIVRDQLGRRPIYFSRTVGPLPDQFGLTTHLEGQGFARKLLPQPVAPSDSGRIVAGLGMVNIARTATLAFEVYHGSVAAHKRPRGWVDHPSEGILATYAITYQMLGDALRDQQPELAGRALALADSIFANTSLALSPVEAEPPK